MCGRYDLSENAAAIRVRFRVPEVPEFAANADLRPTQRAPIVRASRGGGPECVLARWGLVPSWAKDLAYGTRCINARAETVAGLASFRAAYRSRRCLVPVSAWYEWSGPKGARTRFRFRLRDEPLFALAGLWESWAPPEGGERIETYTIITTAASAAVAPIHDRMPVVLARDLEDRWLDPGADPAPLLVPFEHPALEFAPG